MGSQGWHKDTLWTAVSTVCLSRPEAMGCQAQRGVGPWGLQGPLPVPSYPCRWGSQWS